MKKWIGTIIGISVSFSLLFVSQVSVGSEGVADSQAPASSRNYQIRKQK